MREFLNRLVNKWMYTDSHATEITLGGMTGILALPATLLEIGFSIYILPIMAAGLYQIYCVTKEDLACRVKAAAFNTSAYICIVLLYGTHGYITTSPSHSGWIIMALFSFMTAARLNRELASK
jgi:hypothetical protein